jgi:hypothetical protein
MHRRLALLLTSLAVVFGGSLLAPAAQAADGWSVNITTTRAISHGEKIPRDSSLPGPRPYFRPHFTVNVSVVCPAGQTGVLYVMPISGNQSPYGNSFTCTGAQQTRTALPVGAKGVVQVHVELRLVTDGIYTDTVEATDDRAVRVTAVTR